MTLTEAASRLDRWFEDCPAAAVAFSGGVDSALVAWWARQRLGRDRSRAWIADSPSLKRNDLHLAEAFCRNHDIDLRVFRTREMEDPNYARNPLDRCYHCKGTLYSTLIRELGSESPGTWLCSGANHDDLSDFRPSFRAAAELQVRHPLLECNLGKSEVRALSRERAIEFWDKPASPCLSSRIPYGQEVTPDKLAQIEAAELWLQEQGFPVSRVRHHGERAVVEVPRERVEALLEITLDLEQALFRIGFRQVEVDPEGFVSGKLNRGIATAINPTPA